MKITKTVKPIKNKEYIETVSILVNPKDNGGEAIFVTADVYKNADGEKYHNMSVETTCYGIHESKIGFGSSFSPETFMLVFAQLMKATAEVS